MSRSEEESLLEKNRKLSKARLLPTEDSKFRKMPTPAAKVAPKADVFEMRTLSGSKKRLMS